jgi:hypothetical protein
MNDTVKGYYSTQRARFHLEVEHVADAEVNRRISALGFSDHPRGQIDTDHIYAQGFEMGGDVPGPASKITDRTARNGVSKPLQ